MLRHWLFDESGLESVEYAVLTALIVAALVGAITALVLAITNRYQKTVETMTDGF